MQGHRCRLGPVVIVSRCPAPVEEQRASGRARSQQVLELASKSRQAGHVAEIGRNPGFFDHWPVAGITASCTVCALFVQFSGAQV
jgi:hypothetical protein